MGVQPTQKDPSGQPTDKGYAEDFMTMARKHWPHLKLKRLGCPGETTTTMLGGGSRCHYAASSQLSAADAFLRSHHSVRLITVDIGFNDIRPCMERFLVDSSCLTRQLVLVHTQLSSVLSSLQAASPTSEIVGVGHYDPFVADALDGRNGQRFAASSVVALHRLDETLRSTFDDYHLRMANVAKEFDAPGHRVVMVDGRRERGDVARMCQLTWMCRQAPYGPNLHPDDRGYWAIAHAINAVAVNSTTKRVSTRAPAASAMQTIGMSRYPLQSFALAATKPTTP